MKKHYKPAARPYVAFRAGPDKLWVYDHRTELGMGMHGVGADHLALVKNLGVRIVRHTVYWYNVEKTEKPGVYDPAGLKYYDDVVDRAKKTGIELVLIIHGNAPGVDWANRKAGYERFTQFAGFLANRYPSVRFWEFWNEMDVAFTDIFGARRPEYPLFERGRCYAQMLKAAYPAVKQANPKAWVLVGGLASGDPAEFIRGIYEEDRHGYFDFMNIHTYGVPVNWGMMVYAYQAKAAMGAYGDDDRPLWNTEFGIDAGNLWQAWKVNTGKGFDDGQMNEWKKCIEDTLHHRMYWKILPYQFAAGNEACNDAMKDPKAGIQLPAGHTLDDYGFGIIRNDGKTPRPTYQWLARDQVNKPLLENASFTTDVAIPADGSRIPQGYEFESANGVMKIKSVKINTLEPTVITFIPATK